MLGLPTRYVSNEAHAFVEVYVPVDNQTYSDSHWKRINLGGTGSSTTLDRPDSGEGGDEFNFDEFDPDDIDNMTGEQVTVVLEGVANKSLPTRALLKEIIRCHGCQNELSSASRCAAR